jgi:putative transcriptional regulator
MKNKTTVVRLGLDGKLRRVNSDGSLTLLKVNPIPELSDEFVEAAARNDPDNPPMTAEQLAKARRVPRVRTLRFTLGLSQQEFAKRYRIPLGTLRDWEQGRTEPDEAARAYIDVIAHDPEHVVAALRAQRKKTPRPKRLERA